MPVVVVQNFAPASAPIFARGSAMAELHETVASRPRAHYVEKSLPSAFAGTDLADWLTAHDIDTIVIAGYMTHNCDDSTVKHAVHAGLAVEFLVDATGAVPYENSAGRASAEEIHRVFTVVMQSRFAAVLGTDDGSARWKAASRPRATTSTRRTSGRAPRVQAPAADRAAPGCNAGRRSTRR